MTLTRQVEISLPAFSKTEKRISVLGNNINNYNKQQPPRCLVAAAFLRPFYPMSAIPDASQFAYDAAANTATPRAAVVAQDSDFNRLVEAILQTGASEEDAKKQAYQFLFQEVAGSYVIPHLMSGGKA